MWHEEESMLVLKMWSDEHRRTPVDVFVQEPFDFEIEWARVVYKTISELAELPILS